MHHSTYLSLPAVITIWLLITGAGIFFNIDANLRAKEAGKICFRLFSRGSLMIRVFIILIALTSALYSVIEFTDNKIAHVALTVMFLLEAAVWIAFDTGSYVTRKGIIYVNSRRKSESVTARDYKGRIGIFAAYDLRRPVCTVEDTPENREALAGLWREFPERKENPYRDKILSVLEKWEITYEDFNIDFSLPFHCQRSSLNEDLVQAKLRNYLIDIGWYPESDPKGKLCSRLIESLDWQRPLAEYNDTDFDGLEKHLQEISDRVEDFYS